MAGMEQLEVHSKSYLIRWVNVSAGHTISWSIQPHKKSINFGVYKHPGAASGSTTTITSLSNFEPPPTPGLPTPGLDVPTGRGRGQSTSRNDRTVVMEKLDKIGLKQMHWVGKCEAEKVSTGTWDVPENEGGMYGMVFDNTFSKTVSKTVTFVLMTYPTNAPPKSGHHMHYAQAIGGQSSTSLGSSPALGPTALQSSESLPHAPLPDRPKSSHAPNANPSLSSSFLTGYLQKKRRKRNQGYARRFFSLDYTSSTLSYYRNDHSSALRGAIPLSLAAIGANEETREISVDSGAEIWHLRANTTKDFDTWRDALDRASRNAGLASPTLQIPDTSSKEPHTLSAVQESEWTRVETLVGRIAGTRDAVRRLAQDTDPKYQATAHAPPPSHPPPPPPPKVPQDSLSPSPSEESSDYFLDDKGVDKKTFWKRKASSSGNSPASLFRRSVSAQVGVASPSNVPPVPPLPNGNLAVPKRNSRLGAVSQTKEEALHDNCMALLHDLDSVVKDFSQLLAESRQRRAPAPVSAVSSRRSIDSQESADEFFDAPDGGTSHSQLLTIRRDSEEAQSHDDVSDGESETSSDNEGAAFYDNRMSLEAQPSIFPKKPKSLTPLPLDPVARRKDVPISKTTPPSLIAFLRKNVGKDLSTIAMPVTSNEPTSALQRLAEQLEYSELLDTATQVPSETGERLVYMAAFAISAFSNARSKERAVRKPFNPMLGETFELVREDKGFRFVAEKVIHRPVRMACHAESTNWTFTQSPTPVQKFWGKSFEINTDGRARVFLHDAGEHYSWTIASSFLKNVIAGEKYIEPNGTMTILCETTGAKAVCSFKAGGMFAGRSEDVSVQTFSPQGDVLTAGAQGKWTSDLVMTPTGKTVWKVGALVEKPEKHYGFTTWAAALNEVSAVEEGKLPPTDSRLRPDQRAAENQDMDAAEALKAKLEERQRARRRVMEEQGEEWVPKWFVRGGPEVEAALGGEEVWRLKSGKEGYWESRERGDWTGVTDVFEA